jgi:hypothetical protein
MEIEFHIHDSSEHFSNHCCAKTLEKADKDSLNLQALLNKKRVVADTFHLKRRFLVLT